MQMVSDVLTQFLKTSCYASETLPEQCCPGDCTGRFIAVNDGTNAAYITVGLDGKIESVGSYFNKEKKVIRVESGK